MKTLNELILGLPEGVGGGVGVQYADGRVSLLEVEAGVASNQVVLKVVLTLKEETPALRALLTGAGQGFRGI